MFKRMLVGFDGSPGSVEAIRTAINLAGPLGGEVTVSAVVAPAGGETTEDRQASFEAEAGRLRSLAESRRFEADRAGVRYSIAVVEGAQPAEALVKLLVERGFDLLVIGRHGLERAGHRGLGRVARELVEKGRCPVLVVGDGHPAPERRAFGGRFRRSPGPMELSTLSSLRMAWP